MKTVIEMAREAGYAPLPGFDFANSLEEIFLNKFAALVREDEREKYTAVGEVKDGSFGGFVWNEGITSDEAPDGAVLYVRSAE